eukprot:1155905-Pelagomonas_calceolata.AAC.2
MCHTPGEWPFPRSQATNLNKNLGLNQSTPVYAPKAIQSTHHTLQVCGQGRRFLAIPLQASLLSGLAPPCPAHFSQLKNRLLSHTASGSHASALLYQPAWPCVRRYGLLREPGATRVPCEDAQVPQDPCGCAAQGHQGGCNQVVSVDRGDVKEGEQGQGSRTPGDACAEVPRRQGSRLAYWCKRDEWTACLVWDRACMWRLPALIIEVVLAACSADVEVACPEYRGGAYSMLS